MNKYNIGLDIGVASIGWCVTDENYNLLKKSRKNMWGSRIFNEASTAKDTRLKRGTRRRLDRRKERINILQSLINEDMEKEHPNFFPILRETALDLEDKKISEKIFGKKYNIFSDKKMTDIQYFHDFPTIYHLRKYLIECKEKVDIRLVYLAIHHIIKYRGNFLHEGNFADNTDEVIIEFENLINFLENNFEIVFQCDVKEILNILKNKNISKADKQEQIIQKFKFDKDNKSAIQNVVKAFIGYTFDLNKIFEIELENSKKTFSKEIDNEEEIITILGENFEIYQSLKTIYSWYVLQDILNGKQYISDAMIEKYNKYSDDLKLLKKIYKKYFPLQYNDMFREEGKDNYVAFNGKKCKKCKPEEFYKMLKNKINLLPDNEIEKERIKLDLEENNFLVKINVTDNGAIPHQLHQKELEFILNNQSKYYKSINENKENIIKLFSFRIPYYIGPLSKENGKWSWIVRKSNENIRPWNFEEVIDEDATAEEFIKRMTNKCTYLINEDVIPKNSLLYSKYCVLNELNNIRVEDKHFDRRTKKMIIENLFYERKKVTKKMLADYLKSEGLPYENITGLSDNNNFNSSMSSYIDFKKIFEEVNESNQEMIEKIIYWITIFEEKKILKRKIQKEYRDITNEQLNKILKLNYTGWSRLSRKLLVTLKSNKNESIMELLEKNSMNLMQIINNKNYGFKEKIENMLPKNDNKITYKDISEIPTSPANKRAIWQAIKIVEEIVKVNKCDPENIFIEFARAEENKIMKDNRAKQLIKKYDEIEKQINDLKNYDHHVFLELKNRQSDKVLAEKLYLYFMQNGKCLYSGKPLDINNLSIYEVDHILPQSYVKDDSIDNKALVIKMENQRKKDSLLLSNEIINGQREWWKSLLDCNLISQTKYYRLIRNKMFETEDDEKRFVQRQLVETRQITKYVTNILNSMYSNSKILTLRSELTHGFRQKYKLYKNRNVNNYHHAQDAYIISVIGNIVNNNLKYTDEFEFGKYIKSYKNSTLSHKEKYGMTLGLINNNIDIAKVKNTMNYKDCFVTRMLEEDTGEFYNQTLYSPKDNPVIPLKQGLDVNKYGGYSGQNIAYMVIISYLNNRKKLEYKLVGIPIKVSCDIKNKKYTLKEYIEKNILNNVENSNIEILRSKILKNQQFIDENGQYMRFCSDSEIRSDKELVVNEKMSRLIYLMNCEESKLDDNELSELKDNYENMYDYLVNKLGTEYRVFESIYLKLLEKKVEFMNLNDANKKSLIKGLIDLMKTGQGNLKVIELSDRAGRQSGKKFDTSKLLKMKLIDKSITGMYERRYSVIGLENNSNK